jgi:Trk-type K+ transport system membrane component
MIWVMSKFTRQGTALWEELKFLLDHPRRCFTLLFPRNATWWLFAILVALNGIDVIFFVILDVSYSLSFFRNLTDQLYSSMILLSLLSPPESVFWMASSRLRRHEQPVSASSVFQIFTPPFKFLTSS